jgi:hypothetical protein
MGGQVPTVDWLTIDIGHGEGFLLALPTISNVGGTKLHDNGLQ